MTSRPPQPHEQEISIKERKRLLFEEDEPLAEVIPVGERKPFAEYLRTTPAAPLSQGARVVLWGVGVLVALLLILALFKGAR